MTELMPSLCNDCVARNQCGNDDVKMCASYIKEVKIKCDDCKFVEGCVDYGWDGCKKFTPKPSEPMTNEEYLRSCNTEQLAEFIVNLTLLDKYKLYDRMESAEYEHGIGVGAKKVIAEWLKQPHTPKE